MSNEERDSELLTRLSEIESSLSERLSRLEESLEETRMLVADLYRYGDLRDLLAAGKWKEADYETTRIMLEIAGKDNRDVLTPEDLKTFPCNAIRVIDQLWIKYSRDHFGFSVQLRLYQSLGGNMDTLITQDMAILQSLGDRIGWRENNKWLEYDHFDFTLSAPVGSLPADWWDSPYGAKMANFFFVRLIACNF
ncbi:MAG: GUN4 domain-containing protein [Xenococcaceae cyanobacterium]